MKRLKDFISPLSYQIVAVSSYLIFILVFQPTLAQFFTFVGVDIASFVVIVFYDQKVFFRMYPDVAAYFFGFREEHLRSLTPEQRLETFYSLVNYPQRRAMYMAVGTFLKVIPGAIVIAWFWSHGLNPWLALGQFFLITFIINLYFYACIYIENHAFVSKMIGEIHEKHDWTDVFVRVGDSLPMDSFQKQERMCLVLIWMFVLGLQWAVLQTRSALGGVSSSVTVLLIGVIGMIMISRILYLSRLFFFDGMRKIFDSFEQYKPQQQLPQVLPLHSSGMLARFESTFNALSVRLRSYEVELSRWVMKQTDESRFRALGEISALVAHDLSTPLHVIGFCSEHFSQNKDKPVDPKYLNQLSTQVERAKELVDTLKSYLRGKTNQPGKTRFDEGYDAVVRLIRTQFLDRGIDRVTFECDPQLMDKIVALTKPDFIHVLLNLYANAVENMLSNNVSTPKIKLVCTQIDETSIIVHCMDNGKGLTPEKFEDMTAFDYRTQGAADTPASLGLRLIRRLLERSGGSIKVTTPNEEWHSIFEIVFKSAS